MSESSPPSLPPNFRPPQLLGDGLPRGFALPPEDDDSEGGLDIGRYIGALFRHKLLIIGFLVAGAAAGVAGSRLSKPVFEAQASIQVAGGGDAQGPIQATRLFEARGWVEIVRSFLVLDEVVRRRQLYVSPDNPADSTLFGGFQVAPSAVAGRFVLSREQGADRVQLADADGAVVESVALGDSVGTRLGFLWAPGEVAPGASVAFTVKTPRDAAVELGNAIQIIPPAEGGSLLRMQLRGTDPLAIASTVNAVADRFVEVATQLKREDLRDETEVLNQQLSRSLGDLRAAEGALESFRVNTITLPTERGAAPIAAGLAETRDPVFGAFFQLRLDRDALANDRDALRRALRLPNDSLTALLVSLGTIPAAREAPELRQAITDLSTRRAEERRLALTYTDEHAPLRRLRAEVAALEESVRGQARALTDNLDQRIRDLDIRIASSSRELQQIPPRVSEEQRRRREVDIAKDLHTSLQAAYEEAKLAELSAAPDVRIIDLAVPPTTPVVDRILMIIAAGTAGGLALGMLLALLLDRFDHRIRNPEQVSKRLGLHILGVLPFVPADGKGKGDPDAKAYLRESLRSLRMTMQYAHGTAGPFVTTITSTGPGEGKSFLSQHLARACSESGVRTILIDGDTRRGAQHAALGGVRKPGLLDHLHGEFALEKVIQTLPGRGFDLISAGTRRADGPELLASPAFMAMLADLRGRYGAIIIDSPPIGAGIDPLVLASRAGSLVLVLRNGVTDAELVESKLHELTRLPIRVLGAVLNDVQPKGAYKYYSYLPGYRAEDESRSDAVEVVPSRRISGPGSRKS